MNPEHRIEGAQSLLRSAVDAIDDGLALIDRERTLVWVNKWLDERYARLGPLVGQRCYRLIASSDSPCGDCPLGLDNDYENDVTGMPCAGPTGAVEVKGTPLRDGEGRLIGAVAHFHDSSDRTAAENALLAEIDRRRGLFRQSLDGVVVLTHDGAVLEANEEYARQLGYSLDEVHQLHVWDWNPEYSREQVLEMLRRDLKNDALSTRHLRKDGTFIDVEISSTSVCIDGHRYMQCVCRDVSEIKRAQEAQRVTQKVLEEEVLLRRALFEHSRDGIVVLKRNGEVYEANNNYAHQLGYTPEEVRRLHIWDWNKSHTADELVAMLRSDSPRGRVLSTEHIRKDGSVYDVEVTSNAIEFGGEAYIVCVCRDVSEKLRAQRELTAAKEALEEEASRRRLLVQQSKDGIVVLDENGGVSESNAAFAEMLGYAPEEMLELSVWDWEYQQSRERLLDMLAKVDSAGDQFITQHKRKDGSIYEAEISTNGATYGGKKYIFCVCRDISRQQQAAKEREALISQLQEALAELKTLRGIIPVCSFCKKVRDDRGYWEQVEVYIKKNSEADVSHGICPDCLKRHFPGLKSSPARATGEGSDMAKGDW